jgi:hypothetical protein
MAGLLVLQLTGVPGLMAAAPSDKETAHPAPPSDKAAAQPAPPARVAPNRTLPRTVPAPLLPTFSKPPLDVEFYRARIFDEPFVPAAGARDARADSVLSAAILEHIQGGSPSDLTGFEAFLRAHPQSRWTGALLLVRIVLVISLAARIATRRRFGAVDLREGAGSLRAGDALRLRSIGRLLR